MTKVKISGKYGKEIFGEIVNSEIKNIEHLGNIKNFMVKITGGVGEFKRPAAVGTVIKVACSKITYL